MIIDKATKTYSYTEYKILVTSLYEQGKSTDGTNNEARLSATKINISRINRLDKHYTVSPELLKKIQENTISMNWLLITEGWCGDSAQCLSIIAKIAEASKNISLQIILRDENPEIMNLYLTNGAAAIPKLIAFDTTTNEELFQWGPRPTKIQNMVKEYKEKYGLENKNEFNKNLHLWYAKDKGKSLEEDFMNLL